MNAINTQTAVGQLVAERPGRARVFEEYGIDYCCGGGKPLAEACRARGLDSSAVLAAIADSDQQPAEAERDWREAGLTELVDHIQETHHVFMKRELPRLGGMMEKVYQAHRERHPELLQLQNVFEQLRAEIELHLMKEERVLFPIIRQMEHATSMPSFHCGSVQNPISVMVHEHDQAGAALATMRELTAGYTPPEDACNTYRALLDGLAQMEADLHRHIHKENNILFPRTAELEAKLTV